MRILGIDPGTATTGFGVIEYDTKVPILVDHGIISTPAKQPLELRLSTIHTAVLALIAKYKPDQIAVEQVYFARNVTTAISVSHARGVVLLAAAQTDMEVAEYTPLQVKYTVTGYGRSDKKAIQEKVKHLLNIDTMPKPDDAADALAVALCHSVSLV